MVVINFTKWQIHPQKVGTLGKNHIEEIKCRKWQIHLQKVETLDKNHMSYVTNKLQKIANLPAQQ